MMWLCASASRTKILRGNLSDNHHHFEEKTLGETDAIKTEFYTAYDSADEEPWWREKKFGNVC